MLGRQHEERGAEERVRASREDRQLLAAPRHAEDHARALGAADPVALHRQHALGPVLERVHLVEQRVGVVGDLEVPLRQVLGLDLGAAALAVAVDHLLVREHRLVDRAPVDRPLLAVGEPPFVEAEEEPLRPAVVLGIVTSRSRAPSPSPSPCGASRARIAAMLRSVLIARMHALADRRVLGGQAERVVAHRPQDAEAAPAAQVGDDVSDRVVEDVPHVQLARRVRQHLDDVRLHRPRSGRARDWACGTRPRRPRRAASAARSLSARTAQSSLSPGTKKPLMREARGSSRGAAAFASCATEEAPFVSLQHNLASGIASRLHLRRRDRGVIGALR